ncbi:MAG: EamA family transporter [Gemmatimonadetes bacterium]|nr:EamA family transporter [Gemmatimonadota bacterium]
MSSTPSPAGLRAARLPLRSSPALRAHLGLLLMVGIWGANYSIIKAGLAAIPPLAFNALRFPIASAVVYGLLRRHGPIPRLRGADRGRALALGLVGNGIYQLFFITGMEHAHAGIASLLLAGSPILTALLSAALGHERVGARTWAGVFATLVGIALVVLGGAGVASGGTFLGNLIMLGASATWAVYTVGSRPLIERYGPVAFTAWTLWWGTPPLVLVGAPQVAALAWRTIPPMAWATVAYAGVFGIGLAYTLWYNGVSQIGNTRTSIYSNLVPVVGLLAAWLGLGEVPTAAQMAGAAVIIGGVTLARTTR